MKNIFTEEERNEIINKIEEIDRLVTELKNRQKALNEELYAVKEDRCLVEDQRRQLMAAYNITMLHDGNGSFSYVLGELTESDSD